HIIDSLQSGRRSSLELLLVRVSMPAATMLDNNIPVLVDRRLPHSAGNCPRSESVGAVRSRSCRECRHLALFDRAEPSHLNVRSWEQTGCREAAGSPCDTACGLGASLRGILREYSTQTEALRLPQRPHYASNNNRSTIVCAACGLARRCTLTCMIAS